MPGFAQRDKEILAYLESQHIQVIDRAWKHPHGILDAVYEDRGEFVAVVFTSGPVRLSQARVKRTRLMAVAWMNAHGRRWDRVRVDVVACRLEGTGGYVVEHRRGLG